MKEKILQTLRDLRAYALGKGYTVELDYHEEESCLMRFANSAISLNTNEHLIRLNITAYDGPRKRASYEMITDLEKGDDMKKGIDVAAEMAKVAQPLEYEPTPTVFKESFADDGSFDAALAGLRNEEKLAYFNKMVAGLETDEIKLSGIFANGAATIAQANTHSEHTQFFKFSDAQVNAVLAHSRLKWEVLASQSACRKPDLKPEPLHRDLTFLIERYQKDEALQLPLGTYDIVFGSDALADMLNFMNFIGFSGGSMKRGFSMVSEDKIGQKVLSDKVTLVDDPTRSESFPFKRDFTGIVRKPFPLFEKGIFKGFTWFQEDADEFGAQPTGHSVMHKNLVLHGGEEDVATLADLVRMPRQKDLLYIPYLHYMNIVNPVKGIITASSRFGALLLKKDGTTAVPYNVRLTQSLLDIFGDRVAWLSKQTEVSNTSMSYGPRNPTAIIVPRFMCVEGLEISHSNTSY